MKAIKNLCLLFAAALLLMQGSCSAPERGGDGPKIGITYGSIQTKLYKFRIDINGEYAAALAKEGAGIVRLFVTDDPATVRTRLASLDGVLIPGGFDVAPARYGEKPDPELEAVDEGLDALEYMVLDYAAGAGLPVLGICRGLQILNVYHGGSLYQDIPAYYKSEKPVVHRNQVNLLVYRHAADCFHGISIEKGSLLHRLLGTEELTVNSLHHQGVKALAPGFRVTARSADGFVDAIELPGGRFVAGTQFHPEKLLASTPRLSALFGEFVASAAEGSRKQIPAAR